MGYCHGNLRFLLTIAANDDGVPKRVDPRPSTVHDPCQPGEEGAGCVVMSVS